MGLDATGPAEVVETRTRGRRAGRHARRPPVARPKVLLLSAALAGLVGLVVVALVRESRAPAPAASGSRVIAPLPRPALSPSEEAYARALWSIHEEVKAGAFQLTLAGIGYKTGRIDRAALRARVEAAGEVYRRADARVSALEPPASLRATQAKYLEALSLYGRSAGEMARVAEDGQDEHLVAAFPASQEAARTLLEVGKTLWPGEYVPN